MRRRLIPGLLAALALTVATPAPAGDSAAAQGDLVLTHYCAKGNQPHMKAIRGDDASTVAFKFVSLGNSKSAKDGHMHEATFVFKDADHFSSAWQFYEEGKPGEKVELNLVRKSG